MRTYYYEFANGHYCYTIGRMPKCEKIAKEREYGKIIVEKVVG